MLLPALLVWSFSNQGQAHPTLREMIDLIVVSILHVELQRELALVKL